MDSITLILILIAGVILFTILKSFFKAIVFVVLILLIYYGLMYLLDGSVQSSISTISKLL
ncbi:MULTISPECIES: hypothetical protein [Gottfriedia]|uniref:Uncharacterized protein n=1 Tax=Gottfriedia solisilvae TaxID=1516104 RepID=A0A8J3ACE9_9BACI|nr:hypothetical protein [Gottfriedia solisilvae]GGI10573.1 hypothetical protein GCM10007380_03480 [Gottfriedia solisilvae]